MRNILFVIFVFCSFVGSAYSSWPGYNINSNHTFSIRYDNPLGNAVSFIETGIKENRFDLQAVSADMQEV